MLLNTLNTLAAARKLLDAGGILAYPTESVYGLGCDPWNTQALERLVALKGRSANKGLIVLISTWSQLWPLIAAVPEASLLNVRKTWPGPVTWLFPKAPDLPDMLTGEHRTLAIRMSAHPIAHQLCCQAPIVSTSANRSGEPPAKNLEALQAQFPVGLDGVFVGELGGAAAPSSIYDVLTGVQLR